ncbi:unnamed protein product, partial [Musa acuminata subsp. burmannicoides]
PCLRSIRPLLPCLRRCRLTTFSTVFPPPSTVIAKHSSPGDLYRTLNRQSTDGQIGNAQNAAADVMSRGSPTRGQTTQGKDGKPVYPNESEESACFGSSVHYALHQTESLELQKVQVKQQIMKSERHIKLMKGTNQATQTLPLEVNGGKVPYITEDIDLIRMLYVFRGRRAAPLPARNLALGMSRRGSTWRHMRNKGKRKNSSGPSCSVQRRQLHDNYLRLV